MTKFEAVNFRNGEEVALVQAGRVASKALAFIRAGQHVPLCLHGWSSALDVDVCLSLYKMPDDVSYIEADFHVFTGGLSKYDAFSKVCAADARFLSYEHVMFLDYDVEISCESLVGVIAYGRSAGLDIFQPSLSARSKSAWPFLFQSGSGSGHRYVNFVEVMSPVFSRTALATCRETFSTSISTWGLEYAWGSLLSYRNMAVIDAYEMTHEDDVDTEAGPFYKYLKSIGVNPWHELRELKAQWRPAFYFEHAGPTWSFTACGGAIYFFMRAVAKLVKASAWRLSHGAR